MIPLSRPFIEEDDIQEVVNVLKSGRISLGPYLEKFERAVSEYVEVKHVVAVSSGTAALHLILEAMNPRGRYMMVPSFTFVASVNVGLYVGLKPLFLDIDPETFNVSPSVLEDALKRIENGKFEQAGERISLKDICCFMGVDIFGQPLDWDKITALLDERGIPVIEDSCEALGSEYKGRKAGTFGIAGAFAFYPNKQITTGEGGVVITNDDEIATIARSMRNQGRGEGGEWLLHVRKGYNYRMDEMSAALGYSQMKKLERIIEMRNEVARRYATLLESVEGVRPPVVKDYTTKMSWFAYVVLLEKGINRDCVMKRMEERGVQTRNYFQPVHLQPFYKKLGFAEGMLPVTEDVSRRTLALPFYTTLTLEEQKIVVETLKGSITECQG